VVVAGCGLVLLFALWWLYELEPSGDGLTTRRARSLLWGYGHYGLFAALAALGAGLEVAVRQTGGHAALGPVGTGYAVAVPTAAVLALLWVSHAPVVPRSRVPGRPCCSAPPASCCWNRWRPPGGSRDGSSQQSGRDG
jgi:hypothetical protein